MGLISDLNERLLSRESLKTISSNIRQKQHIIYKCKVLNLHEVVIDFSSFNNRSILVNSSFRSIGFVSNKDDWKNFTPGTIYKSSD